MGFCTRARSIFNILLYCSAINLCEYKIMWIGQFWRLLNFVQFLIMWFYCQNDSSYDTESMRGARQSKKKKRLAYSGLRTALDLGINLLIALYDALFWSRLLVSKRHTKSSSATLQYLHSYFPDTIKLWNTLPYNIVSCTSLGAFKHALYTHFKHNVH